MGCEWAMVEGCTLWRYEIKTLLLIRVLGSNQVIALELYLSVDCYCAILFIALHQIKLVSINIK